MDGYQYKDCNNTRTVTARTVKSVLLRVQDSWDALGD